MQIKFFTIPINSTEDFEKELNTFIGTNKILEMEKSLIQSSGQAYWCIYINYIGKGKPIYNDTKRTKIDYKKVLPEPEYIRYEQLRTVRKEILKQNKPISLVWS